MTVGASVDKSVLGKPPTFSGGENVDGFIRSFERWAQDKGVDSAYQFTSLRGALRDEAKEYAFNL